MNGKNKKKGNDKYCKFLENDRILEEFKILVTLEIVNIEFLSTKR